LWYRTAPNSWVIRAVMQWLWNRCLKRNIEAPPLRNHFCRGAAVSITQSECVFVAGVIQHAKRVRRIILPSVACTAVQYFSTLFHKWRDFRKKSYRTQNVFWFPLQVLSATFLIIGIIQRDIFVIFKVFFFRMKCPNVILVRF
jgi:hypothetical protein